MRFAGVPFFVVGSVLFVNSFRSAGQKVFAFLIVGFSPFGWFYLNEARLYSMLLGSTFLLLASLVHLKRCEIESHHSSTPWLGLFACSLSLMCALTVLGMIWASAAVLALPVLFSFRTLLRWLREHWLMLGATALFLLLCAGYYVWTRSLGTRAANIGGSNWKSFGFVAYELLGFNGLGPGRLALREGGVSELKPWLPALSAYGATLLLVFLAGVWHFRQHRSLKNALLIALPLGLPVSVLLAISLFMSFRLLARHCTPVVGITSLLLAFGAFRLWECKRWWARTGLCVFLGLSIVSCLSQRFSARHAKDDYRDAAVLAKAGLERGQSIWWNADAFGCAYYQLPATKDAPSPGKVWVVNWPPADFFRGVANPDVVIVSKPDIFDPQGSLQSFLKKEGYLPIRRLPAFVVFGPPPKEAAALSGLKRSAK
jgi:hypothetical protein